MKLDHFLTPHTKINSKQIKELSVRAETIKLLEENISRTLFDINCSNTFMDLSSKAKETKINKWDLITLKSFFTTKKAIEAAIQKSTGNKFWRGCGEKGTLLHCWWECKLVQPL